MNVVYLSPGFPAEMPLFVRGLAQIGARVYGVGDQPRQALPPEAQEGLTDYLQVRSFGDIDEIGEDRLARGVEQERGAPVLRTAGDGAHRVANKPPGEFC